MERDVINNPVVRVDGNPITSYNPPFINHTIKDQVIVYSNGYFAHLYQDVEYRKYVHKNAGGHVVRIDPWIIHK